MDKEIRKPFSGVLNIIRFNWHFYLLAFAGILILVLAAHFFAQIRMVPFIAAIIIFFSTVFSLVVSWFIYDHSSLYTFSWLQDEYKSIHCRLLNVHAGFDETTLLLQEVYPLAETVIADFYDPQKHTEISIKRARKKSPPGQSTICIQSSEIPFPNEEFERIFITLSAHEIRDENERVIFFSELNRVLHLNGQLIVTEHLRDPVNFLAFNIGFFHFYSKATWLDTFNRSGFQVKKEIKITPFISSFVLYKNGTSN